MSEKKLIITAKGASQKQWSVLLLEFNLIKKAWRPLGINIDMATPGLERILSWGTKKHNESEE